MCEIFEKKVKYQRVSSAKIKRRHTFESEFRIRDTYIGTLIETERESKQYFKKPHKCELRSKKLLSRRLNKEHSKEHTITENLCIIFKQKKIKRHVSALEIKNRNQAN